MRPSKLFFQSLLLASLSGLLGLCVPLHAEGVQQVAPSADDMVMLLIGDAAYGDFATEDGPESGRLYFQLTAAEEMLYIGLSQEYSGTGSPTTPGSYRFRIKRASDGATVHGPFTINSFAANLSSWEDAIGPAVLNNGQGYDTSNERYRFAPQEAGLYYIEFGNANHIGYWDFTVGTTEQAIPGRVYSRNWAMRAPVRDNDAPECVWDREFDGTLYSYTTDGFVTRIDFAESGLQPLSFTLAFNTRGPGNSGDLGLDRMSREAENATSEVAEHLVFLEAPDPFLFPDGDCGQAEVAPFFECTGPNTYCLAVSVTQPGQIEVVLDFNQNGRFDANQDRRLLHRFAEGTPLMDCLDWDGRLGDGSLVDPGARINLIVQYTQGVQHWALFDGEYLKEGFCVEPIRPICNNGILTDILYWDDRNVIGDAGTGQPKDGRSGCACEAPACRTWNNFSVNRACNNIDDEVTTGYGDKNTLNTWWFANVVALDLVDVPLIDVVIGGATEVCVGTTTTLDFTFTSNAPIANLTWTGPDGVRFSGPTAPRSIEVSAPGLYTLTIEDANGCSYTDSHSLTTQVCVTDVEVDITVDEPQPQMGDTLRYTITLANTSADIATGITLEATLPAGLGSVHLIEPVATSFTGSIAWENIELGPGESLILRFRAEVIPAFDYRVEAEVMAMDQPDIDSTPANGVDTNANGNCADDAGDEDDGDCVAIDPEDCSLTISITSLSCDPNGTLELGSDDLFTFDLTVTGANGAETWTGTLAGTPISGTYGTTANYGPFLISSGDLSLSINDGFFVNSCTASTIVAAPQSCSDNCSILVTQRNIQCQDNSTPFDGDDDTYTVEVRLTGANTGTGWNAFGGFSGVYGEWVTIGPFPIAEGDVTMNFVDAADPGCSTSADFVAPLPCSTNCRVLAEASTPVCTDNNTPTDPSDDTFTFSLTVTGDNTSSTWQTNDTNGSTGAYGQTVTMGPYAIADGGFELLVSDAVDVSCRSSLTIVAPASCSDECALSVESRNVQCQDNSTPFDGNDDTYTVEVRLTGANTGTGWNAFGGFSGAYGEWVTIGPFPIAEGNVTMNFVDAADPGCSTSADFVAPLPCSTNCRVLAEASTPVCTDNNTPTDPSDDTFTFSLTVTGDNTSSTWQTNDTNGSTGAYGQTVTMGPYAIADGGFELLVSDAVDVSCRSSLTIVAPASCSDECELSVESRNVQCQDNSTPFDGNDDTYTAEVRLTGANTGTGWNAFGGFSGAYGEWVTIGPFPIAEGNVTMNFVDAADPGCTISEEFTAPAPCSTDCRLEAVATAVVCDDGGTPFDPQDDTFSFTLSITGDNTSPTWQANDANGSTGAYGQAIVLGPYLIAAGDLELVISDSEDGQCRTAITVTAPTSCSDQCIIDLITLVGEPQCLDNGTSTVAADDRFSFELRVEGRNTATSWTAALVQQGQTVATRSGNYDEVTSFSDFLIEDGPVTLTLTDTEQGNCGEQFTIEPPLSCSNTCVITTVIVSEPLCDDNGTPIDPSDDTFTFTVQVDGLNLGASWNSSLGTGGVYGVPVRLGPFSIAAGEVNFTITDGASTACQEQVEVLAPASCSDECALDATFSNVVCNDNNTPSNPTDDTYTFDLLVSSINATSEGWETSAGGVGAYGIVTPQGPYRIADGVLDLIVNDNADAACASTLRINPPTPCSDDCLIDIEIISVDCEDVGTPEDASDDVFTYTLLVTGENTGDRWIADDGTSGVYGQITTSVAHDYDEGTITVVVVDEAGSCSNSFTLSPPSPALTCPEDTDDRAYTSTVQILRGELDQEDDVFTEYPCFLAASSNPMTLGDRFFDAIIIYTPDEINLDTTDAVYSFHLFSNLDLPEGASMEGGTFDGSGVLTRGNYQAADDPCCFSMNYDDDTRGDIDLELENPDIDTTGYFNQPMALVQKFKQTLKRGEQFSLTVSTFAGNNTGEYAWVISAEVSDTLRLDSDEQEVTSEVRRETLRTDLTFFDIPWAQFEDQSLTVLGQASVAPSCGVDSLYRQDLLEYDECEGAFIRRTFALEYGEQTDTCTQLISFRRPDLSNLVFPPATVTIECGEEYPLDDFGNPSPRYTGYPFVQTATDTVNLIDRVQFFNLEAFYKDSISVNTQLNTQTWDREWSIVDYCGDTISTLNQMIKLGDFVPPTLVCPLSNHFCPIVEEDIMQFPVDPFECTATIEIAAPEFRGFCEEARAVDWTITTELLMATDTTLIDTIPEAGSRSVSNLALGDYLIRYSATHHNGERVENYCRVRVADLQPPQAICETSVIVDLAQESTFTLDPARIDRGSSDNCGALDYALRRQYERDTDCIALPEGYLTEWGPSVTFSCCDVNQFIAVDFRVMDQGGNMNGCALRVQVIDSQGPAVEGLAQQSLNCQALPADFDPLDSLQRVLAFGQPSLIDACEETLVELEPLLTWDDCNLGEIARRFQIKDPLGNLFDTVLVQRNTVSPSAFYSIRFPADITTACVEELPGVEWVGGACSDFRVEVRDEVLEASGAACYRLARTYTVTDNCIYDGMSTVSVLSRDENCNGQEGEQALWLVAAGVTAFTDADSDATNGLPAAGTLGSSCGGVNPVGYWRSLANTGHWEYTQIIRIVDDVAPLVNYTPPEAFCTTDASCTAAVAIDLLIQEFCLPGAASVRLELDENNDGTIDADLTNTDVLQGSWPAYELRGEFPVGTHAFVLGATDGCGNTSEVRIVFTVADCYLEPVVCATGIEVVLEAVSEVRDLDGDGMEDEAVAIIPAASLAAMAGLDCSGPYLYTVNTPGEAIDFQQDELILTCEDRYQATVEVVVRDGAFNPYRLQPDSTLGGPNYGRCLVAISVQDPEDVCRTCSDDELQIGGGVYDTSGDPLGGVRVELFQGNDLLRHQTTGLAGNFLIDSLVFGWNYLLRPSRTFDVTNGLSLLDYMMLQRHINGSVRITDPYVLLAADLNSDGAVTTLDYNLMREILLGRMTTFPGTPSWRFFPSDYELTDIGADIPDFRQYFLLNNCQFAQDFTGVKIGDLNGSVRTIFGRSSVSEQVVSSRNQLPIFLPQQQLKRGDIARIPLRMRDLDQLSGLDLNMVLANDQLRLLEVEPGLLSKDNIALPEPGSGRLKAIWASTGNLVLAEETVLFTLVVVAQTDTELSRGILLSAQPTSPALAYDRGLAPYPLRLVFDKVQATDLTLLANYPDPFQLTTTVGFVLPKAGSYTLEVRDITGRVLFRQTTSADAGAQQVVLDGSQWASGVLNCTLTFGQQRLSRRMVKIN